MSNVANHCIRNNSVPPTYAYIGAYINFSFVTKIISLSNAAYGLLRRLKREKESFSDVVLRIAKGERKPLMDFAGKWEGDDADEVLKTVLREREAVTARNIRM